MTRPTPSKAPTRRAVVQPRTSSGADEAAPLLHCPGGTQPTTGATFAALLHDAMGLLAEAESAGTSQPLPSAECVLEAADAHRDLADALAHLGRTLADLAIPTGAAADPGPVGLLIDDLEHRGRMRAWDAPDPVGQPARTILGAARLTRAAADLWSTHSTPSGAPRSPESARLRHPAYLGAALRDWRRAVRQAAGVAERLTSDAQRVGVPAIDVTGLVDFPRPPATTDRSRTAALEVRVAMPPIRSGQDPLSQLCDRVMHLRSLAWSLAENGHAPVPVLRNLAALGTALCHAAADATRTTVPGPAGASGEPRELLTGRMASLCSDWTVVLDALAPIRTLHAPGETIHLERLEICRLLRLVVGPHSCIEADRAAEALTGLAEAYSDVATYSVSALRAAHRQGAVYITGRAIPGALVTRRSELLRAKLEDLPVPAPTVTFRRLEQSYAAIADHRAPRACPTVDSPAA